LKDFVRRPLAFNQGVLSTLTDAYRATKRLCHSERSEESRFWFVTHYITNEIPRFARNDRGKAGVENTPREKNCGGFFRLSDHGPA
jgi:hypothetical protein